MTEVFPFKSPKNESMTSYVYILRLAGEPTLKRDKFGKRKKALTIALIMRIKFVTLCNITPLVIEDADEAAVIS